MKKLALVLLVIVFTGCAWYQERMTAADACLKDPACKQQVEAQANFWRATASASGLPFAGAAAGTLVTGLALLFARRKK